MATITEIGWLQLDTEPISQEDVQRLLDSDQFKSSMDVGEPIETWHSLEWSRLAAEGVPGEIDQEQIVLTTQVMLEVLRWKGFGGEVILHYELEAVFMSRCIRCTAFETANTTKGPAQSEQSINER